MSVGSGFLLKFMAERFGVTGIGIDPGVPDRLERFASGGSVRFVNQNIDLAIYMALASIDGREVATLN